jgi:hypothetical protein
MSLQFNVNKSLMGDVTVQGGVIIDTTQSPTASILIGHDVGEAVQSDPNTNSYSPAPAPSGGSGRNIIIQKTVYSGLPDGLFFPFADSQWVSSNYGEDFGLAYGQTGGVPSEYFAILDQTDIIATAPIGVISNPSIIQCSSAYETGGGIGVDSIGNSWQKVVYLGTATGLVDFTYDSLIGNCAFVVYADNSTTKKLTVNGSGTAQFNKTTSFEFATVVVYPKSDESKWEFTLGCPGGGAPPFTPPTTRSTFNATLTTYGLTLTGGVNIPIVCTFEGTNPIKTASVTSDVLGNFNIQSDGYQRFYDIDNYRYSISLDYGTSGLPTRLFDYGGVVATLPSDGVIDPSLTDPTGSYESTTYGADKYNAGVPFNVFVQLNDNPSLTLVHYYVLNLTGGGSISSYEGPISAPTLPANTATKKHIPVASFDSSINTLLQLWEGPILWR